MVTELNTLIKVCISPSFLEILTFYTPLLGGYNIVKYEMVCRDKKVGTSVVVDRALFYFVVGQWFEELFTAFCI